MKVNFKHFKRFLASREQIAFETEFGFLRNPSKYKQEVSKKFYADFPFCHNIAYHVSLTGNPNLYVIDIDRRNLNESKKDASIIIGYLEPIFGPPIVKFSGNRGYHIIYKADKTIDVPTMLKLTKIIEKETETNLDKNIYRPNHLIRGFYSIHFKSKQRSYIVDKKFRKIEFKDELFDLNNWNEINLEPFQSKIKEIEIKTKESTQLTPEKTNETKKQKTKDTLRCSYPCISFLELKGTEKGKRHYAIFVLTTYLMNFLKLNNEEIIKRVLNFNRKCNPPEDEKTVEIQVKHILKKRYIMPSCSYLKSNGFCIKTEDMT